MKEVSPFCGFFSHHKINCFQLLYFSIKDWSAYGFNLKTYVSQTSVMAWPLPYVYEHKLCRICWLGIPWKINKTKGWPNRYYLQKHIRPWFANLWKWLPNIAYISDYHACHCCFPMWTMLHPTADTLCLRNT